MLPFLFICCLLVICVKFPRASSLSCSFNFSKTREPCRHELECWDDAHFASSMIELSRNDIWNKRTDSLGAVWYAQPVPLWNGVAGEVTSFTTTFFLAPNSIGGGFGNYSNCLNASSRQFFAVGYLLPSLSSPIEENTASISLLTSITASSTKFPSGRNQRTRYRDKYREETMHIPFLCSDGPSDGNSVSLFREIQYNQTYDEELADDDNHSGEVSSRSTAAKSVGFGQARKLLRGNDRRMLERSRGLRPRIPVLDRKKQHPFRTAAIAVGLAFLGLLICTIAGVLLWCNWNNSKAEVRTELCPSAPRRYSHNELAVATQMFADEAKIGRGGFGPVYRGYLCDQNRHVAIKVLSQGSSVQGKKEFEAEVRVMTKLRHRNIVELIGWCDGPGRDLLLVYQFMPNGSLDKHLYNPQRVLTWSDRYKIVLGVGSAILYLHTECEQCVVHGDIKPANIMLDASCNPKLGDFGLARLVDHEADPQTTQIVAGTMGYIDPEFVNSRRPRAESDVYSFGVVLLETACGRRPASTQKSSRTLVNWVCDMYRQDSILAVADRRLDAVFDEQQLTRVLVAGLWCTHQDQSQRPSIAQAMDVLRREHAELPVFGSEMHIAEAVGSYGDFSGGEDSHESPAQTEYLTSEET